jgi:hypothetical protein
MALTMLPISNVFADMAAVTLNKSPLLIKNDDEKISENGLLNSNGNIALSVNTKDAVFGDLAGNPNKVDMVLDLTNADWDLNPSDGMVNSSDTITTLGGTAACGNYTVSNGLPGGADGWVYTNSTYGYTLTVAGVLTTEAVLSVTSASALNGGANNFVFPIPIIATAHGGNGNASVTVSGPQVTATTLTFAIPYSATTTTTVNSPASSAETMDGFSVVITESRPNVIGNGYITLEAPGGTSFNATSPVGAGTAGLTGATATYIGSTNNNSGTNIGGYSTDQYAVFYVSVPAGTRNALGSLVITGLSVDVDDTVYSDGDSITLDVSDGDTSDSGGANATYSGQTTGISGATITIGTLVAEGVTFTAAGDPTTVTAGALPTDAKISSDSADAVKSVKVTFQETSAGSWSTNRKTYFTLPDGVVFRGVKFETSDNTKDQAGNSLTNLSWNGTSSSGNGIIGVGYKDAGVTLDPDTLTLQGMNVNNVGAGNTSNKSKIEFEAYVSVTGSMANGSDVDLTLSCRDCDDTSVTIATVQQPFSFDYDNTTGTLTVTENYAGAFGKGGNNDFTVQMSDQNDLLALGRGVSVSEVTNALNLSGSFVRNTNTNYYSTSGMAIGGSSYVVTNTRLSTASSGPATFEITGLPIVASSDYVWLTVGGGAVAANYKYLDANIKASGDALTPSGVSDTDVFFDDSGYEIGLGAAAGTDGTNIPTSSATASTIGTATSTFVIGDTSYTMNGQTQPMDAAPFLDGNNTMIPVRYLAYALGFDDSQIVWNPDTQTATLVAPGQYIVQLTVNSPNATVNGTSVLMVDQEGNPVSAINKDGRVYLPLRAVTNLFGVPVAWDGPSQTITIN